MDELALQFQGTKDKLLAQIAALKRLLARMYDRDSIVRTPRTVSSGRAGIRPDFSPLNFRFSEFTKAGLGEHAMPVIDPFQVLRKGVAFC